MKCDYMNLYAVGKNCEVKPQQHLGSTSFNSAVITKNLLHTEPGDDHTKGNYMMFTSVGTVIKTIL